MVGALPASQEMQTLVSTVLLYSVVNGRLQVSVVPEGSELLPGGFTVLMRLPRSYTHAAQSDFLVDLLVNHSSPFRTCSTVN